MKKIATLIKMAAGFPVLLLFSSCYTTSQSYYLSPQNANSNPYHTIPMQSDSVKGAFYGSFIFTAGNANYQGNDRLSAFQGSIYRSNNFGMFQAYYGGNLALGAYNMAEYYSSDYRITGGIFGGFPFPIDTLYHIPARRTSFGSYGLSGGINFVIPVHRGEWRALGLETSLRNEFGNYAAFRKNLPDTAANIIFKQKLTSTFGLYTDILWRGKKTLEYGFKIALGMMVNPKSDYTEFKTMNSTAAINVIPLTYFSMSFHTAKEPYSAFIQFNVGTYADNLQIGMSYRLGKK